MGILAPITTHLSLLSCNFLVILCICWDTPSENLVFVNYQKCPVPLNLLPSRGSYPQGKKLPRRLAIKCEKINQTFPQIFPGKSLQCEKDFRVWKHQDFKISKVHYTSVKNVYSIKHPIQRQHVPFNEIMVQRRAKMFSPFHQGTITYTILKITKSWIPF